MKLLKQYKFWISMVLGLGLFLVSFPFYHDIYIALFHTAICVLLNAFSATLFGTFVYFVLENKINADSRAIFLWFTIVQVIGHSIFVIMNWGSFLFLALSVVVFIVITVSYLKDKRK